MRIPDDIGRCNRTQLEIWCRAQSQIMTVGHLPQVEGANVAMCRVLGKYLMYIDTRDVSIAPHLAMNGYWEMWVTQFLARVVAPGEVVYDVGANFGYFTLLLSDLVGSGGTVVAFEPQDRVGALLDLSLQVNDPANQNVLLERIALSDEQGEVELHLAPDHWGGTTLLKPEPAQSSAHRAAMFRAKQKRQASTIARVQCDRLDSCEVASTYTDVPDLIKIDAEGAEPQILRGMSGWFREGKRPKILLEWCPSRYPDPPDFLEQLSALYPLQVITDEGIAAPASRDYLLGLGEEALEMVWLAPG